VVFRFPVRRLHLYAVDPPPGDGLHVPHLTGPYLPVLLVECECAGADGAESQHTGGSDVAEHHEITRFGRGGHVTGATSDGPVVHGHSISQ